MPRPSRSTCTARAAPRLISSTGPSALGFPRLAPPAAPPVADPSPSSLSVALRKRYSRLPHPTRPLPPHAPHAARAARRTQGCEAVAPSPPHYRGNSAVEAPVAPACSPARSRQLFLPHFNVMRETQEERCCGWADSRPTLEAH